MCSRSLEALRSKGLGGLSGLLKMDDLLEALTLTSSPAIACGFQIEVRCFLMRGRRDGSSFASSMDVDPARCCC